jgi:hypothetical protein
MVRKLLLAAIMALPLSLAAVFDASQASARATEENPAKLTKDEIIILMVQVNRMPVIQQDRKMELI